MNAEKIKASVIKAIKASPTSVVIMRKPKIDDNMGGYIVGEPIEVVTIDGFIDESSSSLSSNNTSDDSGKNKVIKSIKLYIPSGEFELLPDDYFLLKNRVYNINLPVNLFDIFWQCDIIVEV
jgi:hypothetical protein